MLLVVAGNDRAVRFYERQGLHVAELVDGLAYYRDRMGVVFPADTASFRLLGLVQNPRGCLPRSQRRQGLSPSRDRPAAGRLRACPGSAAAGPGRSATTARPRPSRPRRPKPWLPWQATADDRQGFQKRLLASGLIRPCSEVGSQHQSCTDIPFWVLRGRERQCCAGRDVATRWRRRQRQPGATNQAGSGGEAGRSSPPITARLQVPSRLMRQPSTSPSWPAPRPRGY
jgi:hypothetical protein